ncbi:hypothetical protein F4859DRAFT_220814 [Xylaria cf. heliscus]|nr:hypothetical protein F4859DRAFT_220814 [Xylaria cf. heliscus]
MKFLALSALLAAMAQASTIDFTNNIPVDATYNIGSNFVLTWKASNSAPTDTFQLTLSGWNNTIAGYNPGPLGSSVPYWDTITVVLNDKVKFSDGKYTWPIKPVDSQGTWKGQGFNYAFSAYWGDGAAAPRSFHIN